VKNVFIIKKLKRWRNVNKDIQFILPSPTAHIVITDCRKLRRVNTGGPAMAFTTFK
jgi:hypothetical protein